MSQDVKEIICGPSGPASWSSAAAPAAGVPITGVLNFIYEALAGSAGLATFPAASAPANGVSIAEAINWIYEAIGGSAGLASFPAAAAPANGVSLAEVINFIYEALAGTGGLATFPAAAAPANTVSLAEVLREIYDQQEKAVSTAAAVIANGTATVFTVAGGPILVHNIISVCVTANDATATTLKWAANPTDGDATDLCAASASLGDAVAGTIVNITGTVANAAVVTVHGTAISQAGKLVVPAGVITSITAVGATTGTWTHHLRYSPLARGVTVT